MTAKIIDERVYENAVVQTADGCIIWNAAQQDAPVIRRKYADGTIDIIAQRDGRVILPPHRPEEDTVPLCQHCGERPW